LKTKKLYLSNDSILKWVESNRDTINQLLYDNIFDFAESDKMSFSIMRIYSFDDKDSNGMDIVTNLLITKDELMDTIEKLLKAYESDEYYERCAELLKLKNSLVN
jgi:hypothetical protein